jgi:hypothetical protein
MVPSLFFDASTGPIRSARYTQEGTWEDLPDQVLASGSDPNHTTMLRCQGGEAFISGWAAPGKLNSLQWFDPSNNTWATAPSPPESFRNAVPARDGNTRVLYTTGDKYWLLDDGATEWQGVPTPTNDCPGLPDSCEVATPEVLSQGDRLLIVTSTADGTEPTAITRLEPKKYAEERASAG